MPKVLVIDTETTGLLPYCGDSMFSFSTCDNKWNTSVYRLDGSTIRQRRNTRVLRELLTDTDTVKVLHNAKFDLTMISHYLGEDLAEFPIYDTTVMSRLWRSNLPFLALKPLCRLLFGYTLDDENAVKDFCGSDQHRYQWVPESVMDRYQRGDAERTMLLYRAGRKKLKALPQGVRDIHEMERRLLWATMHMEKMGLRISEPRCEALIADLERQRGHCLRRIEQTAGEFVNPTGPQIKRLLFEKMGFPVQALTPKTQGPRLAKEDLLLFRGQHPIIDDILKYRSYQTGEAHLRSYLALAREGILHPNINTVGAETGRESCDHPALQTVEREDSPRNPFPVPARRVFVPRLGYVFWFMDFSGIELRILVHYSGDPIARKAFEEGINLHDRAAEFWYGARYTRAKRHNPLVAARMYNAAKNATFAIHYGAGVAKTAATLGLPVEEVRAKWADYQEMFPGAFLLRKKVSRQVLEDGFVTTALGRRLYVPRSEHRVGVNYLAQGTAADVIKTTQVRVHDLLKSETNLEVWQTLPVHDELIGEYPRARGMKKMRPLLRKIERVATDFPQFDIPMQVEFSVATDCWANEQKIDLAA